MDTVRSTAPGACIHYFMMYGIVFEWACKSVTSLYTQMYVRNKKALFDFFFFFFFCIADMTDFFFFFSSNNLITIWSDGSVLFSKERNFVEMKNTDLLLRNRQTGVVGGIFGWRKQENWAKYECKSCDLELELYISSSSLWYVCDFFSSFFFSFFSVAVVVQY